MLGEWKAFAAGPGMVMTLPLRVRGKDGQGCWDGSCASHTHASLPLSGELSGPQPVLAQHLQRLFLHQGRNSYATEAATLLPFTADPRTNPCLDVPWEGEGRHSTPRSRDMAGGLVRQKGMHRGEDSRCSWPPPAHPSPGTWKRFI